MNTEKMKAMGIKLPEGFSVGFGREIVNPLPGTGMAGWGNETKRLSEEVVDDLMVTCTAVCDSETVLLIYSQDNGFSDINIFKKVTAHLEETFGIPGENVIINATHTHCAPGMFNPGAPGMEDYLSRYYAAVYAIAEGALRDLAPAKILIGRTYTKDLSFVRRYISRHDGSFIGNWPKLQYDFDARHETRPDEMLQVMRFEREGKKDVVLCNWQCHPCSDRLAGEMESKASSDWVGIARAEIEEREDILFSYHQGACGNVVSTS